ncbi:MAG: tetratricopeptide repeat protein, partial [Actinomycetota bacterium]|nr:tetratricopeptide repeat protein [Actinomycetota bacterium]
MTQTAQGTLPSREAKTASYDLPAPVSSFLGRARELSELAELLQRSRLLTLTGPPGVGKTRLALEAARAFAERHPGGARLVDLGPIGDPSLLPQALASSLSVQESPGSSLMESVVARLRRRPPLLVLDNCEHLVEASAKVVDHLLRQCAGLLVLATSREPLAIVGEHVWRVPPLSVPAAAESTGPESLMDYEAAQLFVERALAVQPDFPLNEDVASAIAKIAMRLDGLPLAIELAAAHVEVLTPTQIASRLDDRFALPAKGTRGDMPRHPTLRAALDWSHDLLSTPERALLRRACVFAGGFSTDACEAVCVGGEIDDANVLGLLARLVANSLVVAETADGPIARYRLLETIRAYATSRLEESGEADAIREAHARCHLDLAETAEAEITGPSQVRWLQHLDTEAANLRCALDWSRAHGRGEWALRLAGALILFWRVRCRFREGRELLEAASEEAGGEAPAALRAKALWGAGFLAYMAGDLEGARPALEESLAAFRELEDSLGAGRALLILGHSPYYHDIPEQLELLRESADLARAAGDTWCLAHALGAAGFARARVNDMRPARPCFEECLAVARKAGDKQGIRYGLAGLGLVAAVQGDYEEAESHLEEGRAIAGELDEDLFISNILAELGSLALGRGDYVRAGELFEQARATLPDPAPLGEVLGPLLGLSRVAHVLGEHRHARALLEEVQVLAHPGISVPGLQWMGELAADEGDLSGARALFERALERSDQRNKLAIARALHGLGQLARAGGEARRAATLHDQALGLRWEVGAAPEIAASLEALG